MSRHAKLTVTLSVIVWVLSTTASASSAYPRARAETPNRIHSVFARAEKTVVKLYGHRVGRDHGYATGFLISSDGRIITALSPMVSTGEVRAILADGRPFSARVIRSDDYRQIALLKIDGRDLPTLEMARSEAMKIGDTVIAMGNWFKIAEGREPVSIIRGILSLRTHLSARRLTQNVDYHGPVLIYDAITSTPGAAGGPLLDIDGRCIGMIGRIVEAVNTNTRLNYAIPSEEILAFLAGEDAPDAGKHPAADQKDGGLPYVGIKISKLGYRHPPAYVDRVQAGSPAAKAGIRPDDLVVAIDHTRIQDADAYHAAVKDLSPGQVVRFAVKRHSELMTIDVTIGVKP